MSGNKRQLLDSSTRGSYLPFSLQEYRQRLESIRAQMRLAGVDLLFLSAPESICYVSGYAADWYRSQSSSDWRPASGVAIRAEAEEYIHFDESDEELLLRIGAASTDVRIHSGPPVEEFVVRELGAQGWLGGTVGLEMWSYRPNRRYSEMFQSALEDAGCQVVDATGIVRRLRKTKSPEEIAHVRSAHRMADVGMEAARNVLRPGVTELQVCGEIVRAMTEAGSENPPITVASGERNACPHALPSERRIERGDIVNIDLCGVIHRYHATSARSFSVGPPAPAVAEYFRKTAGLAELVADLLRPDLELATLFAAIERYCRGAGIWDDQWWIGGYELGIAFPPDTVGEWYFDIAKDPRGGVLPPGLVSTFESNFYLPEAAGLAMQISTMAFTEDAGGFLGPTPPGVIVVE
jgi:Xaa-Pro aminopeptidase